MNSRLITLALSTAALPFTVAALPTPYEQEILKAALVLEAGDQGEVGMEAIIHVFINRAGGDRSRIIGQMVKHKALSSLRAVTNQPHPDYGPVLRRAMRDRVAWRHATAVVERFMQDDLGPDPTDGADHFDNGFPSWSNSMTLTTVIGDHYFFRSG